MVTHDTYDDGGGTPGTDADPETGAEGDTDQLELDDTLMDRGGDAGAGSVLDEGYSPPERRPNRHRLETDLEQSMGQSTAEKLTEEEPEVWDTGHGPAAGSREPDRVGRLAADVADVMGMPTADTMAVDVGMDGGAASAEEAAMHVIDEDDALADLELAEELGEGDEQD
jgi:hypothetical protein